MFFFYSLLLTLAFILMLPLFLLRRQKYAAGFRQRLGSYPEFKHDSRKVIWLHCVSVGETNAARPLVDDLTANFPNHRIVISTTTLTGQTLAQSIFKDKADAVFYFPFDWKFSVRKALANYKPCVVLLMETEIWPRFIREAKKSGANVVIVNGRLSEKSFDRYSRVRWFVKRALAFVDLALMQGEADAQRIVFLGMNSEKVSVTGNVKFDHMVEVSESAFTEEFRQRFAVTGERPLIIAASTHEPEEDWIIEAFSSIAGAIPELLYRVNAERPRLLIAPRHPERFDQVWRTMLKSGFSAVRRSSLPTDADKLSDLILLDSIGEMRSLFPLANAVFVGGSLIPHGGQSVLEPAAAGKAIVIGPFFSNFASIVDEMNSNQAIITLGPDTKEVSIGKLTQIFIEILGNVRIREYMEENVKRIMAENRGATAKTIEYLRPIFNASEQVKTEN